MLIEIKIKQYDPNYSTTYYLASTPSIITIVYIWTNLIITGINWRIEKHKIELHLNLTFATVGSFIMIF